MGLDVIERLVVLMSFQTESDSLLSRLHIRNRAKPLVVGMALVVFAVVAAVAWSSCSTGGFSLERTEAHADSAPALTSDASSVGASAPADATASAGAGAASAEASAGAICVHVGGAVCAPGVYELACGARVAAAVEAAGGFSSLAAPDAVNLARELVDGEQVIVPTEEQYAQGFSQGGSAVASNAKQGASALVNINTATAEELDSLPGIGNSTAQKIIADRNANGPFSTIDDLKRVPGIGEKKYDQLSGLICV